MTAPNLAARLRAIADSLERESGLGPDDPDLLTLKRLLLVKATALESETPRNALPSQTGESTDADASAN